MNSMDYWRLCDEVSVAQAALLIIDIDAKEAISLEQQISGPIPRGYVAASTAIKNALLRDKIEGTVVHECDRNLDGTRVPKTNSVNIYESTVMVDSLRAWLLKRGFRTGFFFPNLTEELDFLNADHPRYAPKLAASIGAWLAVDDDSLLKGKSPKQALSKWLRENASIYKLSDQDGNPNNSGIEECAKVANWDDKGGAPKILGETIPPL